MYRPTSKTQEVDHITRLICSVLQTRKTQFCADNVCFIHTVDLITLTGSHCLLAHLFTLTTRKFTDPVGLLLVYSSDFNEKHAPVAAWTRRLQTDYIQTNSDIAELLWCATCSRRYRKHCIRICMLIDGAA